MQHTYEIILRAELRIEGLYGAETAGEAVEMAKREMLNTGQVGNVTVERQMLVEE